MAARNAMITNAKRSLTAENLNLESALCPVCRTILIEPVTLPCSHVFCRECFDCSTKNSNLTCPQCRLRVSSWFRTANRKGTVVDDKLWKVIQEQYPLDIKMKLQGSHSSDSSEDAALTRKGHKKEWQRALEEKDNVIQSSGKTRASLLKEKQANKKLTRIQPIHKKTYICQVLTAEDSYTREPKKPSQTNPAAYSVIPTYSGYKFNQDLRQHCYTADNLVDLKIMRTNAIQNYSNNLQNYCFMPIEPQKNHHMVPTLPLRVHAVLPANSENIKCIRPPVPSRIVLGNIKSAFAKLDTSTTPVQEIEEPLFKGFTSLDLVKRHENVLSLLKRISTTDYSNEELFKGFSPSELVNESVKFYSRLETLFPIIYDASHEEKVQLLKGFAAIDMEEGQKKSDQLKTCIKAIEEVPSKWQLRPRTQGKMYSNIKTVNGFRRETRKRTLGSDDVLEVPDKKTKLTCRNSEASIRYSNVKHKTKQEKTDLKVAMQLHAELNLIGITLRSKRART